MLPLTPRLLVSTATTIASFEYDRSPHCAERDRASVDAARSDASLRFVNGVGFWSHFAHRSGCSSWPLPQSQRIEQLSEFAELHGGLVPSPLAGDIFLLASAGAKRHVLAGIVAEVETVKMMLNGDVAFLCLTIEGELEEPDVDGAAPRVAAVRLVRRRLSPANGDSFIRWCEFTALASQVERRYVIPENLGTIEPRRRQTAA